MGMLGSRYYPDNRQRAVQVKEAQSVFMKQQGAGKHSSLLLDSSSVPTFIASRGDRTSGCFCLENVQEAN